MKKKIPDWLPKCVNPKWLSCPAFQEEILNDIKGKIKMPSNPLPQDIFKQFYVDPDELHFIVVNDRYPFINETGNYKEYSIALKEIWDELQKEYQWEIVEQYLQPNLRDWTNTLVLSISLTENQEEIWKDFMSELFEWFASNGNYYIFCFMDSKSFEYSKYVKDKHEIFYKFHAKEIQEKLTKQWGHPFFYGLPF